MSVFIIVTLILFGAILVLTELLFVPGITVVGLLGLVFSGLGVYYSYQVLEPEVATYVLIGTVLLNIAFLIFGFRAGVWNRFTLKDTINSRSFDDRLAGLEIGLEGWTKSDCKPFGKAEFGDVIYEVKSETGFIPVNTKVYIHKLEDNKIIVKQ